MVRVCRCSGGWQLLGELPVPSSRPVVWHVHSLSQKCGLGVGGGVHQVAHETRKHKSGYKAPSQQLESKQRETWKPLDAQSVGSS